MLEDWNAHGFEDDPNEDYQDTESDQVLEKDSHAELFSPCVCITIDKTRSEEEVTKAEKLSLQTFTIKKLINLTFNSNLRLIDILRLDAMTLGPFRNEESDLAIFEDAIHHLFSEISMHLH